MRTETPEGLGQAGMAGRPEAKQDAKAPPAAMSFSVLGTAVSVSLIGGALGSPRPQAKQRGCENGQRRGHRSAPRIEAQQHASKQPLLGYVCETETHPHMGQTKGKGATAGGVGQPRAR